ncbi:hypothetical protein FQN50_004832 [Emmonsiellopsis sp. PD_5]|nr:hypothetical protein FQN50_004832 [Emmonsiellopsis sp. PD_5]
MPDTPQSASPSSPRHPPPLLRFPKLPAASSPPAAPSFSTRLAQHNAEAMTSDIHSPYDSSLSDSWATLSSSDVYSEDETRSEHTDLASLVGRSVPDDVTSLEGRDDLDSEADSTDVHSYCSEPAPFPHHLEESTTVDDSKSTLRPPAYPLVSDSIEFVEPDTWPEFETIELKHTIRVYTDDDTPEVMRAYPYSALEGHLSVTVQQTMAKTGLDLDKPFRVFYIGHPDFKHIILDKLGDVLVAGSDDGFNGGSGDSSRFHVVPASFGTGASPNYAELLPIHFQLIVDECVSVSRTKDDNYLDTLELMLRNRGPCRSKWTGSNYQVQSATSWTLPDVAIIFMSEDDTHDAQTSRSLCQTFMKRHKVPTMVISENPLWDRFLSSVPVDYQSLHICLESRDKETGESRVAGRFPIDLKTFESITPGQLNRNLATLSRRSSSKPVSKRPTKPKGPSRGNTKSVDVEQGMASGKYEFDDDAFDLSPQMRMVLFVIFLGMTFTLGYGMLKGFVMLFLSMFSRLSGLSITPHFHGPASGNTGLLPETATAADTAGTSLMPTSLSDLIPFGWTEKETFDIDDYLAKVARSDNESDKLNVHLIGDCHIIVKLPSHLVFGRRSPKFDVTITRADQQISFGQSRLFDRVYTLQLPREDAYGPLTICISTKSNPVIKHIITIDLGTPWLKIASWKKAAQELSSQLRKDFIAAHVGIRNAHCRLRCRLFCGLRKMGNNIRGEGESVSRDSFKRVIGAASSMLARSKQFSDDIVRRAEEKAVSSSTQFLKEFVRVHKGMFDAANEAWTSIQQEAKNIHQTAHGFDFSGLAARAQQARKSEGMAQAQKQASRLWQHIRSTSAYESAKQPNCKKQSDHRC